MILLYYVLSILVVIYFFVFSIFPILCIQKLKYYYCKIILYRHVEQRKRYYRKGKGQIGSWEVRGIK